MRRRELIGLLLLAGCVRAPRNERGPSLHLPALKLVPASLGIALSLAQRLTVTQLPHGAVADTPDDERSLDVQLEVDAAEVRLAAFALGQRVLMLRWDGRQMQEQRHPMLPAEVDSARVLRDIQLCYWPAPAIRAALPEAWTLDDAGAQRRLGFEGEAAVVIDYAGMPRWQGRAALDNRAEGYRLSIESNLLPGP